MVIETKYAKAFKILCELEYSNKPEKFLHKNQNEEHLTIGGVYGRYDKTLDWTLIKDITFATKGDFKRASVMLYADEEIRLSVFNFFKKNYWNELRLDEVQSQLKCEEIFLSAVHIGVRSASKLAQRVIRAKDDGYIGDNSLKLLNAYNEQLFDNEFDNAEIVYYTKVLERKPELKYAWNGFLNRAYKV